MNIIKLTEEQKTLLENKLIKQYQDHVYFFVFQLDETTWAITAKDQEACDNSDLLWLKELPVEEYIQIKQPTTGSI